MIKLVAVGLFKCKNKHNFAKRRLKRLSLAKKNYIFALSYNFNHNPFSACFARIWWLTLIL